ncbi:MAG: hypothetical protein KJZ72_03695 [Anaerolineales bacterium]|nr:hypothetical protein [Anaerolineales bacterium]
MNDDFIHLMYQSPSPEFARSLYTKLMQGEEDHPVIQQHQAAKRIATIAVATLCLITLILMVSPTARVTALTVMHDIIEKITVRGVTVLVSDEPPNTQPAEESVSYSMVWSPLSPDRISSDHPFFAKLPGWVPSGYVLQEQAALYYASIIETPPSSALFQWENEIGELIQLEVMQGSCLNGQFHDPDDLLHDRRSDCTLAIYITVRPENKQEVLTVHDQPAVFFHGIMGIADLSGPVQTWNPSRWKSFDDGTNGLTLIWENEGRTYSLITVSTTMTKQDLLHLAESIP